MIKEAIGTVVSKGDLTQGEMEAVMNEITKRNASSAQIASFVTALRMKGETPEEIAAAARIIRDRASAIHAGEDLVCLDREEITVEKETILATTKTSAKETNTFNISTATALVVAAGGLRVAKYGRKSGSHLCGSADVVEALGINLDMTRTQLERCAREVGICFLYEPLVQNGLAHIIAIRKKIGLRTIFNLLDPLINPARAKVQVLGVYDPALTETMAVVLKNLGIEKGLVVHGEDTLDEMSITGQTKVTQFEDDEIRSYFIQPEDFGLARGALADIAGGTREQNAEIIQEILTGSRGARRDVTVLNAAATFMIAGRAQDITEGIELANQSIDSGEARKRLQQVVEFTRAEHSYLRKAYEVETDQNPQGDIQRF